MRPNTYITLALLILLPFALFQGCASTAQQQTVAVTDRPEEFQRFYAALDGVVRTYKVGEASDFPVDEFPYLRTNRFLAAIKDRIMDEERAQVWVEQMLSLDLKARKKEISNLPGQGFAALADTLGGISSREDLMANLEFYANRFLAHDRRQPGFYEAVKAGVNISGEYSTAMRTFGLYPVAYYPVVSATKKKYDIFRGWHQNPLEKLEVDGSISVFAPPRRDAVSPEALYALFSAAGRDALGRPDLTETELKQLISAYAPVIYQDVAAGYDFFGKIRWQNDQVTIDYQNHTVYYYVTYGFINGAPALQLNYAFWYSGRWGENAPRIERGPLDGVTVRITLDSQGRPIMLDIMNNCGCYYFSVPRKEKVAQVVASSNALYPFVPTWLPESFPHDRLSLRINSGWHQIQHVYAREVPSDALTYQLLPYDVLEALPKNDRTTESVFTPEGIMKDSSRIEPYIFFSMGIPKVGYMRQRGHHAIKLIGKAHFTDPDLFDNNFIFE